MMKSLWPAWLKRIFQCSNGAWRSFLRFSLEPFWGLFSFHCNYNIKEIHISSNFYSELLQWWSEFRSVFDSRRECQYILWNNKEIRVDNKPVFHNKKKLFEQDFIFVNNLLFELDTTNSFTIISNKISKINYLIWAGLRHSVPKHHVKNSSCLRSEISLILTIDNKEFDILEKKSKDYYMLIKRIINCPVSKKIQTLVSRFQSNPRPGEKSIPSSTWSSVWTLSKSFSIQSP